MKSLNTYQLDTHMPRSVMTAWQKGIVIPGFDPDLWRRDRFGNAMFYRAHGQRSEYGWEIDRIFPDRLSGCAEIELAPTWWAARRVTADSFAD
jgi:hypothetical protein